MATPTRFAGAIPPFYDRHLGPFMFEPYARDLAARLPPGAARVLEVAAGTGRATRHVVAALPPDGALLATDLAEAMVAVGAAQVTDPRVRWAVADAVALPAADASVDAVVCQFGLMFMPAPERALAEMRRVLAPGGRLLLSTWDALAANPASALLHAHVVAAAPAAPPPDFMLVPFGMHDPDALRALVAGAGFAAVDVARVAHTGEAESAAHLATGMVRGNPLAARLAERGVDADAFEPRIAAALAARFGAAPCRAPLAAFVVTATA